MVAEIRQSLDAYPREQLVEILSYVFKEYVVEGAAPVAGTTALIDARTELEGLSFAELMTWLQQHLDVPELAQFDVQGGRVSVRAGGRAIAIEAARQPEPVVVAAAPVATVAPTAPAIAANPIAPTTSAPTPTPTATSPTPTPTKTPTEAQQPAAEEKKDENPASRFSWLEVD